MPHPLSMKQWVDARLKVQGPVLRTKVRSHGVLLLRLQHIQVVPDLEHPIAERLALLWNLAVGVPTESLKRARLTGIVERQKRSVF